MHDHTHDACGCLHDNATVAPPALRTYTFEVGGNERPPYRHTFTPELVPTPDEHLECPHDYRQAKRGLEHLLFCRYCADVQNLVACDTEGHP